MRQAAANVSTILRKSDGSKHFKTEEAEGKYSCTCLELRNYVAVAPEYVNLRFHHTYQSSRKTGALRGSSTLTCGDKTLHTYLKNSKGQYVDTRTGNVTDSREKARFAAGKYIVLPVAKILLGMHPLFAHFPTYQ